MTTGVWRVSSEGRELLVGFSSAGGSDNFLPCRESSRRGSPILKSGVETPALQIAEEPRPLFTTNYLPFTKIAPTASSSFCKRSLPVIFFSVLESSR